MSEVRFVAYAVPDLESEGAFYRDKWRLAERTEKDGMVYFAAEGTEEYYVVRLRRSEEKMIDAIGLAAESAQTVDSLHAQVQEAGAKVVSSPRALSSPGGGYGFRFFTPDGMPFEISSDVDRAPARRGNRDEGVPQRISHIVLHSPRHKQMADFFVDVLGFRVSDWLGDFMCFLRCNEWHHRIAILPGPPCLNHVAYDMADIDDMMRGIARMKRLNEELRWGPGRHTAGNNTFSYFTTPNGFGVEYTAELQRIDEEHWTPTVYAPSVAIMDQWGIGVGGPQNMPHPEPDKGLFRTSEA